MRFFIKLYVIIILLFPACVNGQGIYLTANYLKCNNELLNDAFGESIGVDYLYKNKIYSSFSYNYFYNDFRYIKDKDIYDLFATSLVGLQLDLGYNIRILKKMKINLTPACGYSFEKITMENAGYRVYTFHQKQSSLSMILMLTKEDIFIRKLKLFTLCSYSKILNKSLSNPLKESSISEINYYYNFSVGIGYTFR